AWGLNQIPAFPSGNAWTDTVALTVVISGVVSRLVFGKTGLFGKPEQGIRHCYPPQDKCWIPYHSRIPQLSVLGLGIGLMAGFLGLKFGGNGALLAFGISAFSLIFLHFNTQVPVSHHISLPAALVAVPSGSLIWAAIVGIICAILGELMSRIFLIHGDTHIDPPAMVITIMTTMINLLATIGLFTLVPLF
ncbi:TPA: propanediol utilization system permease GrpO, partial [Escherichia coli]|nr:propanediol utilization system permease GrpO [Escherichia coli]HAL1375147.1 permease [Escherichia coli]HAN9442587.1 permease [Escherichia coli]HAN9605510.1 permease [Escherichia coli]